MNKNIKITEELSLQIKKKDILVVEAVSVKLKDKLKCNFSIGELSKPKFSYVSDEGTLMQAQGELVEEWWLNG